MASMGFSEKQNTPNVNLIFTKVTKLTTILLIIYHFQYMKTI